MKILQICNDFTGSKVHSNLVKTIDALGVEQIVYCPEREERMLGKNQFEGRHVRFVYSLCIKSWYKYIFHYKAYKIFQDMTKRVNFAEVDFIHAHTLFSDGVLAYKAHMKYGIRYAVAIRSTDLNLYICKLRHTYATGRKILLNAEKIYFISVGLKKGFEESVFVRPILEQIKHKFVIQPNGIDEYWHHHLSHEERSGYDVLYVGDFSANKNVVRLAKAIVRLRKHPGFENVRLIIVGGEVSGGGRVNDGRTQQMIDTHPDAIKALGKIYDKEKLVEVMRSCSLFAMPSIHETFGLVYIEALSQNLPVIYTKGQGIDGLFDNNQIINVKKVGEKVNPFSIEDICNFIKMILKHHDHYGNSFVDFERFKWRRIAERYIMDYKSK